MQEGQIGANPNEGEAKIDFEDMKFIVNRKL